MYIVNNAGHLESPNYPEEYQNDNTCVWRLSVPENLQIVLKFQSFEVSGIFIFFLFRFYKIKILIFFFQYGSISLKVMKIAPMIIWKYAMDIRLIPR